MANLTDTGPYPCDAYKNNSNNGNNMYTHSFSQKGETTRRKRKAKEHSYLDNLLLRAPQTQHSCPTSAFIFFPIAFIMYHIYHMLQNKMCFTYFLSVSLLEYQSYGDRDFFCVCVLCVVHCCSIFLVVHYESSTQ